MIVSVEVVHEDHPRVGGEKPRQKRTGITKMGSPPRRRGKVTEANECSNTFRITPA